MERDQVSSDLENDDGVDRHDSEEDFHGQQRQFMRSTFVAGARNDVSLLEDPQDQVGELEGSGLPSTLDDSLDGTVSDTGEAPAPAPAQPVDDRVRAVDTSVEMLMALLPHVSREAVERALLLTADPDCAYAALVADLPSGVETQTATHTVTAIAGLGDDDSGYDTDDSDEAVADTKELQSHRLDAANLLSSHGDDAAEAGWHSPVHHTDVELTTFASSAGRGYGTGGDIESGSGDAALGANSPTEDPSLRARERALVADLVGMGFEEQFAVTAASQHPFDMDAAVQMALTLSAAGVDASASDPSYVTPPRPSERPGRWNHNPLHGVHRPSARAIAADDMQVEDLDASSLATAYQSKAEPHVRTGEQVYHRAGTYLGHKVTITAFTVGSTRALRVEANDRTVERTSSLELSDEEVTAAIIAADRSRLLQIGVKYRIAETIVNVLQPRISSTGAVEFELPATVFGSGSGAGAGITTGSDPVDMTAASGPARVIIPSGSRKLYTKQRHFEGREVVIQVYREGINNAVRVETTDEDGMTTTLHINDEDVVRLIENHPDLAGPSQAVKRAEFIVSKLVMVTYSYHEGVILALSSDEVSDDVPMSADDGPETHDDAPDVAGEAGHMHTSRRPAAPSLGAAGGSSAFGRGSSGLSRHGLAKQPLTSLAPIAEGRSPPKRQAMSSGTGTFSRHFDPWSDESREKDDDEQNLPGAGESKPSGPVKPYGYGSLENPIR